MNIKADDMPMVEAIIVTWNKKNDLVKLLKNFEDIDYPRERLEIVVVDNNSSDGTAEAVRKDYPQVRLIRNRENIGGAGGFNTGMRWALQSRPRVEYLWLLDNDVLLDKNALNALVRVMDKNPDAAICGSKIMNIDNRNEFIEVGAFIDYHSGDVRRNMPDEKMLENPDAVFEVDYVAACSLLARVRHVKKLGVWHDKFFIYWDDMEWGARFNAGGYKVLASNASVIYHPSWAGRVSDNSAIWRNYYRTRNALWFYNNYCSGFRRRLLLTAMTARALRSATIAFVRSEFALSRAFVQGVRDFLINSYGKKQINMPSEHFETYFEGKKNKSVCIFIHDPSVTAGAKKVIRNLKKKYSNMRLLAVVPEKDKYEWEAFSVKDDILTYSRARNGSISWSDKSRIMRFLKRNSWNLFITSPMVPKMGVVWGKDIAKTDFDAEKLIGIEKMQLKDIYSIPIAGISFLLQTLFSPPESGKWEVGSEK